MKTIEERKHTWETAADDATFKDTEDYNARVALWAVNNVDAMFAEIARLNALLADAREGLTHLSEFTRYDPG